MARTIGKIMAAGAVCAALSLAGCAGDNLLGGQTTTAALPAKPTVDPVCVTLASQIEGLRKDGIDAKIEKAAAKKYKLKPADLAKVNELTKASAEFQSKCSTLVTTAAAPAPTTSVVAAAPAQAPAEAQKTAVATTAPAAAPAAKQ